MMEVVHSILNPRPVVKKQKVVSEAEQQRERRLKLMEAHDTQKVLKEYAKEIETIRKYFPGWMPGDKV